MLRSLSLLSSIYAAAKSRDLGPNGVNCYSFLMHQSIETPTLWVPGKGRGFDTDPGQKASISLPPEARVQIKRPYPCGNKDEKYQNPLYCSPLYPIIGIPCFKMVIREALLTTMLMMYFTNIRKGLHNLLRQFLRKM